MDITKMSDQEVLQWIVTKVFDPGFWAEEVIPGYWEVNDSERWVVCAASTKDDADAIVARLNQLADG